jgi:undecaprenyl-diphosphatase
VSALIDVRLRRAAAVSAVLLALFGVCALAATAGWYDGIDARVDQLVAGHHDHLIDTVASALALSAGAAVSVAWVGWLIAIAWRRPRLRRAVAALCVGLAVATVVEIVLKQTVGHPGPGATRSLFLGIAGGGHETPGAFPSGHAIRAVILAGGTVLLLGGGRRRAPALASAVVYVFGIAATRVYLNDHWTADVIGGLLLGAAVLPLVAALCVDWDGAPLRTRRPVPARR